MSTQYGVWSSSEGGFISTGAWSPEEAAADRQAELDATARAADSTDLAADLAELAADLTVKAICSDHDEQPVDACDECSAEDDEEDDPRGSEL